MSIYDNSATFEVEGFDSAGDSRTLTVELHWSTDPHRGIVTKVEGLTIDHFELGRYLCNQLAAALGDERFLELTIWRNEL